MIITKDHISWLWLSEDEGGLLVFVFNAGLNLLSYMERLTLPTLHYTQRLPHYFSPLLNIMVKE